MSDVAERQPGRLLPPIFLIAVTVLLAHFVRLPQFGLWEDDYWSIAPYLHDPIGNLWPQLVSNFTIWLTGRPLNHFLPAALSRIGSALGGLEGVYVLAATGLMLNGVLVFLVVRRVLSAEAAPVAALAYLLFPADSTKILLEHASHVQGAMTFLLLGIWLWLKGGRRRLASYPVAALSLLAYESAYLPFLAVPLLWASDRRTTIRTWAVHVIACAGFVVLDAAIRLSTHEARASDAVDHAGRTVYQMATSLFIGPATSGKSLGASAITGVRHLDALAVLAAALIVLGFLVVSKTGQSRAEPAVVGEAGPARWPSWQNSEKDPHGSLPWWWLLVGSLVVWAGSYALTLVNYPPSQTVGRLTSTHVAAGWPVALAAAALFEGARQRGLRWSRSSVGIFAVWLACMVGYHHFLQREYARAWDLQKRFWRQVMTLAPEAGPGWTVIVDGTPSTGSPVIHSNSWADFHVYRLIFTTGYDSRGPAFAHLGVMGRSISFRPGANGVEWQPEFWGGPFVHIDPSRLALLADDRGVLRRVQEIPTPVGMLMATAAPATGPRTDWPATPVARLLFPERFP